MSKHIYTEEEDRSYFAALPRKICVAGVIITRTNGAGVNELLIVKPSYKGGWLIPGGAVEAFESPRVGAAREAREEIGDCVEIGPLRIVNYESENATAHKGDAMNYLYGGTMKPGAQVQIDGQEIIEAKWVNFSEARNLLIPLLAQCVPLMEQSLANGQTIYAENGKCML